jgi:hypothetical protein
MSQRESGRRKPERCKKRLRILRGNYRTRVHEVFAIMALAVTEGILFSYIVAVAPIFAG